jgi:hypothetical protein
MEVAAITMIKKINNLTFNNMSNKTKKEKICKICINSSNKTIRVHSSLH